jgi:hypothetical protein
MTTHTLPTTEERIGNLHANLGRAIIATPAILDEIPNGVALVLLPHGADDKFVEENVALGLDALRKGRSVYFKWLAPGEWGITEADEQTAASTATE